MVWGKDETRSCLDKAEQNAGHRARLFPSTSPRFREEPMRILNSPALSSSLITVTQSMVDTRDRLYIIISRPKGHRIAGKRKSGEAENRILLLYYKQNRIQIDHPV